MTSPLGHDLSCTQRAVSLEMPDGSFREVVAIQPSMAMAEVTGRACLAEALVRRVTSVRGTLLDVLIPTTTANYGTDVNQWLNDDIDVRGLALIGAALDAEVLKDERVVSSSTTVQFIEHLLIVTMNITDGTGPFKLVLSISEAAVQILTGPA